VSIPSVQFNASTAFSAASAAGAAGGDPTVRSFGLSMRFAVTFSSGDGIDRLGEWASCKGLKVDFKTEPVKLGGEYDYEVKLPVQVSYGPVVLERALEKGPSQNLQAWLGRLVANWMNQSDSGDDPPMGTLDIVLQDVHQNEVASWSLRNAYPVSWSGPALDAKGSSIAIETLTLEHQGFLPTSGSTGA
jgi:phage tail-like protein